MSQKNKTFGESLAEQRRGGLLGLFMPRGPRVDDPDIMDDDLEKPKKGSYTVPKMCGGGKVMKSWSK